MQTPQAPNLLTFTAGAVWSQSFTYQNLDSSGVGVSTNITGQDLRFIIRSNNGTTVLTLASGSGLTSSFGSSKTTINVSLTPVQTQALAGSSRWTLWNWSVPSAILTGMLRREVVPIE